MKLTKGVITREQAIAISPDYVKFAEGDFESWSKVNERFATLKRGQKAVTYVDGQFMEVKVTSINHNDVRALDGPVVRVGNEEYSWRVDGCGYAWPRAG
jgi:hypothetical protein